MTSVLAHSLLPPATNLQQALAECDPTPFQALFPSGFTEVYARERARYQSLRLQAEALETQIRSLEATSEAQRVQAKARLSDLERSSELRLSEHSLALDTVNHDITKFLSIHELYHRLSGLEILQSGTGQFRCKIRVQQNELIFKVSEESDQLLGMTLCPTLFQANAFLCTSRKDWKWSKDKSQCCYGSCLHVYCSLVSGLQGRALSRSLCGFRLDESGLRTEVRRNVQTRASRH